VSRVIKGRLKARPAPIRRGSGAGTRVFKDVAAGMRNILGGRSQSYGRRRYLGRIQGRLLRQRLAETMIGLYKTELIRRRGPWKGIDDVEFATLEWVDWFNHRRLLEPIGDVPPAEFEIAYYRKEMPNEVSDEDARLILPSRR
jgi:hypothetical protein